MRVRCPFGQKDFEFIRTGGGACLQERGLAGQAVARVGADHHRLEDPVAGGVALPAAHHPSVTRSGSSRFVGGARTGPQGDYRTGGSSGRGDKGQGGRSPGVVRGREPRGCTTFQTAGTFRQPQGRRSPASRATVLLGRQVRQLPEVALGVWAVQKARSAIRCGSARSEQSDGGSLAARARQSRLATPPSGPSTSCSA